MSDPLHTPTMLLKNSLNIKTPSERSRYLPRRLLQDCENEPPSAMISPSKFAVVRQLTSSRPRLPLEDHDANSQDSGISEDSKSCSEFRFVEPSGAAPRRMLSSDMSPRRLFASPLRSPKYGTPDRIGTSPRVKHSKLADPSPKRALSFSCDSATSLSSFTSDSTEDGFFDMFQNEKLQEDDAHMQAPMLGNLLSAEILTHSTPPRSPHRVSFQRSISENISPSKNEAFSLKRPLLLSSHSADATTPVSKKHKPLGACQDFNIQPGERGTLFQYGFKRTPAFNNSGLLSPPHSVTPDPTSPPRGLPSPSTSCEHSIKLGFQRSATEELIGDFTKPFALPLVSAKEHDLKVISSETLAKLINGEYDDKVTSYKIIDCRYPYEYDGGHIRGALNLYRRDQISHELKSQQRVLAAKRFAKRSKHLARSFSMDESKSQHLILAERFSEECSEAAESNETSHQKFDSDDSESRNILIFHCEYSYERGPSLFRYIREEDRASNEYPSLSYPEIYLLDGGYKAFFSSYSQLCEPCSYVPMKDPNHEQDLKHFRAKSKSWTGKHHRKLSVRSLSRL